MTLIRPFHCQICGVGMLLVSLSVPVAATEMRVMTQRTVLNATAVASVCRVVVDADGIGNHRLSFGVYNKALGGEVPAKDFTLWLYEEGATVPGCSAFTVAPLASVAFGDPGQLDDGGVVTRGAGERVRIDVRATDEQASYRGPLTAQYRQVQYPSGFAADGRLAFRAKPVNVAQANAGEYRGTLSFVVSYH
ncbi:fimbrial protein [Aeromonas veronii]